MSGWENLELSLVTNVFFGVLGVVIFLCLRRFGGRFKMMYSPRTCCRHNVCLDVHRVPQAAQSLFSRGVLHLAPPARVESSGELPTRDSDALPLPAGSEEDAADLLEFVGLDGIVVLRFARACLIWCSFSALIGVCLMLFYYHAGDRAHGANVITIANVSGSSNILLFVVPSVYFFVVFLLQRMWIELHHIVKIRKRMFENGFDHLRASHQRGEHDSALELGTLYSMVARTVIVDQIPDSIETDKDLLDTFRALFGADVVSAHFSEDTRTLRDLINQCDHINRALSWNVTIRCLSFLGANAPPG